MTIRSVSCEMSGGQFKLFRQGLEVERLRDVTAVACSVAHVIRSAELGAIRALGDRITNCGRKHPAKPLTALLLGRKNIPVVDGGYKNTGQLLRSIKTLLRNASGTEVNKTFVIGAADALFEDLWARAQDVLSSSDDPLPEPDPGKELSYASILDILPHRDVPAQLDNKLIGHSVHMQFLKQLILQAAQHDGPVLILGDTGTGKDVVARAIHACGNRRNMLFVPVNCGAIANELLESELFGHKKGAFTGAHADKVGLWKAADHGVLFLDEVGDLSLQHQVKVLRALDSGRIRPVGANDEEVVDVQVIAATNRDLMAMMNAGQFRADLYYRLRSFLIYTEPLWKHAEDIPLLARHFWREITHDPKADLSDEVVAALKTTPWIGNVRDLKWTLVSLYRYTGLISPTPKHLRTVVWYESQKNAQHGRPPEKRGINAFRVECLMHLQQADDALRACKVSLRPMLVNKRATRVVLEHLAEIMQRHFEELELLCAHPVRFSDEATFKAVYQFKCGVGDLLHILRTHPGKARAFWEDKLSAQLQSAAHAVFQKVSQLLDGK